MLEYISFLFKSLACLQIPRDSCTPYLNLVTISRLSSESRWSMTLLRASETVASLTWWSQWILYYSCEIILVCFFLLITLLWHLLYKWLYIWDYLLHMLFYKYLRYHYITPWHLDTRNSVWLGKNYVQMSYKENRGRYLCTYSKVSVLSW